MLRKPIAFVAAAALSLAASIASASPFPWTVNESGFDNPAAMAYAEQHPAKVTASSESPFPWTVNESGFDNPAAMAYAEQHPAKVTASSESPFPWTVNESGPYVPEETEAAAPASLRTAGR